MKLNVILYNEGSDYHMCHDERGEVLRVDLMVCGTLPKGTTPQSLVGEVVTCECVHPFLVIAQGVSIDSSNTKDEVQK
jgi:hypothetical protein